MHGLEAISAYNGWAMALFGMTIVMSGLALLSFIISQFPRAIALLETSRAKPQEPEATSEQPAQAGPDHCLADLDQLADLYRPLVEQLGESFELRQLYEACQKSDFPHPHLTIRALREARILVPGDEENFYWNQ